MKLLLFFTVLSCTITILLVLIRNNNITENMHQALNLQITVFHRITESENGRGWKGPLWVI